MSVLKAAGPKASVRKYDILSAMMAYGLEQDKQTQRRVMRLMLLITARYNWRNDDLTIGHKEIAKLWSVDPRTVKREMAVFKSLNWIHVKQQGARGRVGSYGIRFTDLLRLTQKSWNKVGSDFEERAMQMLPNQEAGTRVVRVDFGADRTPDNKPKTETEQMWLSVCDLLQTKDPNVFDNWFSALSMVTISNSTMVVRAPSRFVARYIETHLCSTLLATTQQVFTKIDKLVLEHS